MDSSTLEDLEFQKQYEKVQKAVLDADLTEPRAIAAFYDQSAKQVVVTLRSGATFSFPVEIAQGLRGATPEKLAQLEVMPMGDGLHWQDLDADFSMAGLLNGVFGAKRWMAQLQAEWQQSQVSSMA